MKDQDTENRNYLTFEAELVERYRIDRTCGKKLRMNEVLAKVRPDRRDTVKTMLLMGNLLMDVAGPDTERKSHDTAMDEIATATIVEKSP